MEDKEEVELEGREGKDLKQEEYRRRCRQPIIIYNLYLQFLFVLHFSNLTTEGQNCQKCLKVNTADFNSFNKT